MLDKIDVTQIVRDHLVTLRRYPTTRRSPADFALFFGVPLLVAIPLVLWKGALRGDMVAVLFTVLAVFAALLFNLLLLLLDLAKRERRNPIRIEFLKEIYANVAFAILVAILASVLMLSALIRVDVYRVSEFLTLLATYLSTVFALTLLMILKRMHALLTQELLESSGAV